MNESVDAPFKETYKSLINSSNDTHPENCLAVFIVEECELPLIDFNKLKEDDEVERENCKKEIAKASREWGFFQVVNHGISDEIFEEMRSEQMKLFNKPFSEKVNDDYYSWGKPTADSMEQFPCYECFHVPLTDISASGAADALSSTLENFAKPMSELALKLAGILAEKLGVKSDFFKEQCLTSTCYVRMNRYNHTPCSVSPQAVGLTPHTDSNFITVLHQDLIEGLQLFKDGKWFAVKPRPQTLIINIGDLFQAWSNGIYKSVKHRVVVSDMVKERFSVAFFMCPFDETEVKSCVDEEPSVYRNFTLGEYRRQVKQDVKAFGRKIGLSKFLI